MRQNWCQFLSPQNVEDIHETSMKLMQNVGVLFPDSDALAVFRKHGFRIDGQKVHFDEQKVLGMLGTAPKQFTIHARNPRRDVTVGDGIPVFTPGAGAPFLADPAVGMRTATLDDCRNLARLAHMLPNIDTLGHVMVVPADVPANKAYLHVIHAAMVHSDKPFSGSVIGGAEARKTMEMVSILFGEEVRNRPVIMGGINSLTPLSYSFDMVDALMEYARWGQPIMLGAAAMAGATAPITLAGLLAVQNAELLAGAVLTQLVNPGTPVLYGSASGNMDMKKAMLCIGSPEFALLASAHAQLARHYGLPCKGGGALTDSHSPDFVAGFESMQGLLTAVNSGVDFIVHAGGILSSFKAFSLEKFILDNEMCGRLRRYQRGIQVNPEALAYDLIAKVGPGGQYLTEMHTLRRCRSEFWMPTVSDREEIEAWMAGGQHPAIDRARERWQVLLAEHEDPPLDKTVANQLKGFVEKHSS